MSWQSAPASTMSRSTLISGLRAREFLDHLHGEMRNAAQMHRLVAALEHQHVRIALAGHVADALERRAGERERPALDHLGAQLRVLDVVDLGQVLDDRGAQRVRHGTPLNGRCSSHAGPRYLLRRDRIGLPPVGQFAAHVELICSEMRRARSAATIGWCFDHRSFRARAASRSASCFNSHSAASAAALSHVGT